MDVKSSIAEREEEDDGVNVPILCRRKDGGLGNEGVLPEVLIESIEMLGLKLAKGALEETAVLDNAVPAEGPCNIFIFFIVRKKQSQVSSDDVAVAVTLAVVGVEQLHQGSALHCPKSWLFTGA